MDNAGRFTQIPNYQIVTIKLNIKSGRLFSHFAGIPANDTAIGLSSGFIMQQYVFPSG